MKNSEYWKKRFVEMEEATHQTSVKKIFNIQEQFDKSAKVINEKINSWYQRYAENNNMSMLDAKKSLNAKELKELKWDVEKYEIVATLDGHTSDICQEMDGKVFQMSEYEEGVTAPPFHVNCRSCTAPYFDDEFTKGEQRAARDEDGNTYYVPADMTYKEWKKSFVKDSISPQTRKDFAKYSDILGENAPSVEEFAKIRYNTDEWKMFKTFTSSIKSGELSALADFDLYKDISKEMDEKILGVVTSNNLTITGKSNHSIARVIGSIEQKRNGVQVSDILDALINKDSEILPVREMKNGRSQKFRNKVVEVSVNPDTGNIIQVNPVHTRRKKVES